MNALLRALMMRASTNGGGGSVGGGGSRLSLGLNIGETHIYSIGPGPVNRVCLLEAQDGSAVSQDDAGPTADFRAGIYRGPAGSPFQMTGTFTGKVSSLSWAFQRGGSNLSAASYNAGTNKSTFTFDFDPSASFSDGGPLINFNGAERTPGGAKGVTSLDIRPTSYVGNTNYWTDELIGYLSDFGTVRTMDLQSTNNDRTTTDWNSYFESDAQGSIKSIVRLANEANINLWVQIPTNATADWDNHLFAYLDANLDPDLHVYVGYSNETWNPGFYQFSRCVVLGAIETKGAAGTLTGRKINSIAGDGATTTVNVDYTMDLVVGDVVACTGFNGNASVTVTAVAANSFSFASSYSGSTTPNSSVWFVSKSVTSTLLQGGDPYNLYGIGGRYAWRRIVEASDRCRAIVGDAKMMTRFRPVLEHQGINNDGSDKLQYVSFLAGGDAEVKKKIYGLGGAPYFYLDVNLDNSTVHQSDTANHSVDDYVGYYSETMPQSKYQYQHAQRKVQAIRYGVKVLYYEGSAEQTGVNGNSQNNFNKNEAKLTAAFGALYLEYLKDMGMCGVDLFMHYNGDMWKNTGQQYCYGFTDHPSHVTPYWQAFKDYNATDTGALPALNPIGDSTVLDARLTAGKFPPASGGYPAIGNNTNRRAAYLVVAPSSGTWSVVMNAAANSPTNYTVQVNAVEQVSNRAMQVSNSYPDLTVFNDAAPWTLTLNEGMNSIEIICSEAHGPADQAIKSLTFTRLT